MATFEKAQPGTCLIGRAKHGADLLEELTAVCAENNITLGSVTAIGALQKARVGYYNQDTRSYEYLDLDRHLEITALVGNVSLKDDKPIIHAHVSLSDNEGRGFGGHLAPGTIVFACEFVIQSLEGAELCRGLDDETGLPLWKMD